MTPSPAAVPEGGSGAGPVVTVHYWASARAAAGTASEELTLVEPLTVAELTAELAARHGSPRLREVLDVCSVLVGDRPAGRDRSVRVHAGDTVEFLPPFAGG